MGFQSSYSIPEFIDPHSTPKPLSTPRDRYRPLWLPLLQKNPNVDLLGKSLYPNSLHVAPLLSSIAELDDQRSA
ncbi:hypothetical protein T07_13775 [Trichinella nelsoni]|uniref:Uncharacterized protein n=1 Tax=Trichinella nelsoni TaxID=6336 RepID=A0A0V0S6Q0_9BILA|nr:hypothetical protein T07_13775 [Trichinella nelsoni]